jgi:copper homeostasis protein (lipoprotein)
MLNINLIISCFLFLLICSCSKNKQAETLPSDAPDMHSSEISLDWQGIYTGTIPCADCSGIETSLSLNDDKTYILKRKYIDKSDEEIETSGSFLWNDQGNKIILTIDGDKQAYFVGEMYVIHLDKDGNKISGEQADKYILRKL